MVLLRVTPEAVSRAWGTSSVYKNTGSSTAMVWWVMNSKGFKGTKGYIESGASRLRYQYALPTDSLEVSKSVLASIGGLRVRGPQFDSYSLENIRIIQKET
jgi:hypothetical protein